MILGSLISGSFPLPRVVFHSRLRCAIEIGKKKGFSTGSIVIKPVLAQQEINGSKKRGGECNSRVKNPFAETFPVTRFCNHSRLT